MKYLFINIVAGNGSTGRIAAEQCRALQAQGHECVLAYGRWAGNCDDITTYRIGTAWDYKVHGVLTRLFDWHGFGSAAATRKFIRWIREYDPDVIWLHNLHGYYLNVELLFAYLKTCGKTIYWTLHDCWAFTGHCAYFTYAKCSEWKARCGDSCAQLGTYPATFSKGSCSWNYDQKKRLFNLVPADRMELITPSKWLADLVRQSFLAKYPVEVRYNTIDASVFKPTPSDFRERYGIGSRFMVLGVASPWTERKGLADFVKLANGLNSEEYAIVLVGLSEKQLKELPANIIGLARTDSLQELASIYTAADVFFNPTREDNYPTTLLEAQACGTSALTYLVGGCAEALSAKGSCAVVGFDAALRFIDEMRMEGGR